MGYFETAWYLMKEMNESEHKKKIIACLKKEGGAANLSVCAKACGVSPEECKKVIASMPNVKMHSSGDVILMDGISKAMPGQASFVTLVMPESAYDTIMETLYMDLRSGSIDDSIKARLQQALNQIQQK